MERLGVAPQEVVFLDDLGINLKTARHLGFHTIKVLLKAHDRIGLMFKTFYEIISCGLPVHEHVNKIILCMIPVCKCLYISFLMWAVIAHCGLPLNYI